MSSTPTGPSSSPSSSSSTSSYPSSTNNPPVSEKPETAIQAPPAKRPRLAPQNDWIALPNSDSSSNPTYNKPGWLTRPDMQAAYQINDHSNIMHLKDSPMGLPNDTEDNWRFKPSDDIPRINLFDWLQPTTYNRFKSEYLNMNQAQMLQAPVLQGQSYYQVYQWLQSTVQWAEYHCKQRIQEVADNVSNHIQSIRGYATEYREYTKAMQNLVKFLKFTGLIAPSAATASFERSLEWINAIPTLKSTTIPPSSSTPLPIVHSAM